MNSYATDFKKQATIREGRIYCQAESDWRKVERRSKLWRRLGERGGLSSYLLSGYLIERVVENPFGDALAILLAANFATAIRSLIINPRHSFYYHQRVSRVAHRTTPLIFAAINR